MHNSIVFVFMVCGCLFVNNKSIENMVCLIGNDNR